MIIRVFPSGPLQTNAYLIGCYKTLTASIIDPSAGSAKLINECVAEFKLKVDKILLTHSHWDHFGDAALLKAKYGVPLYVHEEDAANLERPGSDGIPMWNAIAPVKPDHFLKEGDRIAVGNLEFVVIHTPGHSPGGVCFYEKKEAVLIAGDTLFQGSIGNLSLPTADPESMWKSLAKLAQLPQDTQVYPGHGPSTSIGEEDWLPKAKEIFG